MSTNTLVNIAKARFKHQEFKLYLQEKYTSLLNFTSQGGNWTASVELIAYLKTSSETSIIIDNFKNPILVNTKELLEQMENIYTTTMNEYYQEFQQSQRNR